MKNKLSFYYSILVVSSISFILFLFNIKNNNKKFNQNLLTNADQVYFNYLESLQPIIKCECQSESAKLVFEKLSVEERIDKYIFPFRISVIESDSDKLAFDKDNSRDLSVYFDSKNPSNLEKLILIIKNFAINKESLKTNSFQEEIQTNYFTEENEVNYKRFINIFVLKSLEDDTITPSLIHKFLHNVELDNVYIKYLHYDINSLNSKDFYNSIKQYNSPIILEELQDNKILNVLVKNVNKVLKKEEETEEMDKSLLRIKYIEEMNIEVFSLDFSNSNIYEILTFKLFNSNFFIKKELKNILLGNKNNHEFLRLANILTFSKQLNYHFLFTKALINLNKFNEILKLYDSLKNYQDIYDLYDSIQENLIKIIKNNFDLSEFDSLIKMYSQTNYLLQSSNVQYDHFFSFEFKIGMFLPVLLPLAYASFKIIKLFKNKKPNKD